MGAVVRKRQNPDLWDPHPKGCRLGKPLCWFRAGRRTQDTEAPRHELGDGVNCSMWDTPGRGHPGMARGLGSGGGLRRSAGAEEGIGHFISQAADLPAHPWPGAGGRRGRGRTPPRSPTTSSFPFPHILAPPIPHGSAAAGPWCATGMLRCGATGVAQPPGGGQGPAGLAEGWGGTPAPAWQGRSRQLGAAPGPSVLFLEGLLGDERPEGVIPEAGADAEPCGQWRER